MLPDAEPITFPTARRRRRPRALLRPVERRLPRRPTASCRRSWCSRTAARPARRRRRCRSTGRSSRRGGSPSWTWTTAARPATGGRTATRSGAGGGSRTSRTASRRPGSSWSAAPWTRPGWRSAAAAPAATRRSPRSRSGPEVFAAGISHFGIADLELIHVDGHKFESRYDEGLVAPWTDEGREGVPRALADPLPGPRPGPGAALPGPRRPGRAAVPAGRDGGGVHRPRPAPRGDDVRGRGPRLPAGRDEARRVPRRSSGSWGGCSGSRRPTGSSRWTSPAWTDTARLDGSPRGHGANLLSSRPTLLEPGVP